MLLKAARRHRPAAAGHLLNRGALRRAQGRSQCLLVGALALHKLLEQEVGKSVGIARAGTRCEFRRKPRILLIRQRTLSLLLLGGKFLRSHVATVAVLPSDHIRIAWSNDSVVRHSRLTA
jgi:hypothetical protein